MDHDWIDNLGLPKPPLPPDAPDRGERYIAVSGPFWSGLKDDLRSLVDAYNRHGQTRHQVTVEDADARLLLRGLDQGLDITFKLAEERIVGRYQRRVRGRHTKPRFVDLRLEMQRDGLVVLDRRGCPVDDPGRYLMEPFLRSLRSAERPTYWDSTAGYRPPPRV